MSPCKSLCVAPARRVLRSAPFPELVLALLVLAATLPAFAAEGIDVSPDELYSDDLTITTVDGSPLDIDADGNVDLVVGANNNDIARSTRYYLGNGDGTFDPTPVLLDNRATSEIVAADFDGDSFIDIVQGVRDQRSAIYLGNGAGGVGNAIDILDDDRVLAVAVGDLDLDGDLDLVTGTGHRGGEPQVNPLQENRFYLNNSTPGAPVFDGFDISADADDTRSIALADLDGDGDLDVIAGNDETTPGSNRVYLNQFVESGNLTVSFAAGIDFGPADDQTSKILVGDLNGDSQPDLVVLNFIEPGFSPGTNRFFLNESAAAGAFQLSAATDLSADTDHSSGGTLGDFDGDGDLDIAVANLSTDGTSPRNRLYLNQFVESGSVSFVGSDISADAHHTRELAAGDIDADGDLDLVAGNQPLTGVPGHDRVYLNNGTSDPFGDGTPSFTSTPVTDATAGTAYGYGVTTSHPDPTATLAITAPALPAWLVLTDHGDGTATLEGTPGDADVGDHAVTLEVSDGSDTARQDFTIAVAAAPVVNQPPTFSSSPVEAATEDESYTYDVTASDPDGDPLVITAPTLPAWLTLTDNGDGTATLTGTPAAADVGEHDVELAVSDGTDTAAQAFTVTVEEANAPEPPPPSGGGGSGGNGGDGGGGGTTGWLSLLVLCAYALRRRALPRTLRGA